MDTGSIARAAPISPLNVPHRAETLAAAGAVRTDLPPEAAVQQLAEADAVRFEPSDGAQARAKVDAALRTMIERHIEIDPKTREVVYQIVDSESGEVIRQTPDQALLRLRAYAREMLEQIEAARTTNVERLA
jgi:flagellar protein FlaG